MPDSRAFIALNDPGPGGLLWLGVAALWLALRSVAIVGGCAAFGAGFGWLVSRAVEAGRQQTPQSQSS